MDTLRRLRNFWIPLVATIVLGCFSNAVAQTSYKVTDLGINNSKDNFSMANAGECIAIAAKVSAGDASSWYPAFAGFAEIL